MRVDQENFPEREFRVLRARGWVKARSDDPTEVIPGVLRAARLQRGDVGCLTCGL